MVNESVKTQQEALELLVRMIELAHSRGAFTISETVKIAQALKLFEKTS